MEREAVLGRITLKNVGFDLRQAANYHANLLQRGADVGKRVEEVARDLRSYESESLEDNIFSFYPYFIHTFEGERKIFSVDNPKPEFLAISQIDPRERQGAVVGGFRQIEKKLPEKGFFVWVSTDGDAGIHDIKYRYHQVYLGNVDGSSIQASALKCDIDKSILAEWLSEISKGQTIVPDLSPRSFITSPVVLESAQNGVQSALLVLKEVLARHSTDRFYKNVSIDKVIINMPNERARQEEDVRKLKDELEPYLKVYGKNLENLVRVLGAKLYDLYSKYRNKKGDVTLTGCAGGTKSINELFEINNFSGLGIFSTDFRIKTAGIDDKDYNFDHQGQCVVCHKDPTLLGPCEICISCDAKMGGKAAKKAA